MKQLKIFKKITPRESASLEKYFHEISNLGMVCTEDEIILARKIKTGDDEALNKLVKANLRFVVSVAKQYQNKGLSLGDLINEGNIGLIKAATVYDEKRGFKFISYAVWWIRQCIILAIGEQGRTVRLPLNRIGSITKINNAIAKLEQSLQREPSFDELAIELDLSIEVVARNMEISARQVSVDSTFNNETNTLLDILEDKSGHNPDSGLLTESVIQDVLSSLTSLSQSERKVIVSYFGLEGSREMTLEDIGESMRLSAERIRQIKSRAIRKIRYSQKATQLLNYL